MRNENAELKKLPTQSNSRIKLRIASNTLKVGAPKGRPNFREKTSGYTDKVDIY